MRRQHTTMWRRGALSAALFLGLAVPANAVDGVIEINQALAKAGGVTPGDTPLFPVTISRPGSFRLTGNLDVTDAGARPGGMAAENTTAIEVTADNVTIDLNGFTIKGPTVCPGSPTPCAPTGDGAGVLQGIGGGAITVRNGTIQGMGGAGLTLGGGSRAEKIRAVSNGSIGISAHTVTDCEADRNGATGINALKLVSGSTAERNDGPGIWTEGVVTGCAARYNHSTGIKGSTVTNCEASSNGRADSAEGVGIAATTATGCTAFGNAGGEVAAPGIKGQNMCGSPAAPCP